MLKYVLSSIYRHTKHIAGLVLIIQATTPIEKERYKMLLNEYKKKHEIEITSLWFSKPIGSAKARRIALKVAYEQYGSRYIGLMLEDDFLLPSNNKIFKYLIHDLNISERIGCIIGKVINLKRRNMDPDFYLKNTRVAELLTKLTGYIFMANEDSLKLVIFGPQFMAIKLSLVDKGINYDINYTGTGFREESDIQLQILKHGYFILYDSRTYVYHVNLETGGNRAINMLPKRIYWKARNHTYFLAKHFYSVRRLYYTIMSTMILSAYNPVLLPIILKGIKDGWYSFVLAKIRSH